MRFKRYIIGLTLTCLIILLAVSGFNWLVDPYAIFDSGRIHDFNEEKPFAGDRGRTTKLYQPLEIHPAGLIVGNSRAEMGLDPNHVCWPQSAQPVYNAAIPGLSVYHQVRYAQHAIAAGNVSAMVMSVDFFDFLNPADMSGDPTKWPPQAEQESAFLVDPDGHPTRGLFWARVEDYSDAVFSLQATIHSVLTILQQGLEPTTRTAQGFNPAERFYDPIVRHEGVGVLFAQKNREVMDRLTSRELALTWRQTNWSADFEALSRMILHAKAQNIDFVLYFSPYHFEYLASIDIAGLWPLFEEWKRRVSALALEHSVPLWDFALIDKYSTEPTDTIEKTGESLNWFWEPAHFRRGLGDLMLANIWRETCYSDVNTAQYGTRIEEDSLEAHLMRQRTAKDQYLAKYPLIIRRLKQLREGG